MRFLRKPHVAHRSPKLKRPRKVGRCPACTTSIYSDDEIVRIHGQRYHRECGRYTS